MTAGTSDGRELEDLYLKYSKACIAEDDVKAVGSVSSWCKFVVYLDLRKKGRLVHGGLSESTLSFTLRGEKIEVLPVIEGFRVRLDGILRFTEMCRRNERKGVVAIVDKHGEVTYYEVSVIDPKK